MDPYQKLSGVANITSSPQIPEFEQYAQRIHAALDRIFNKLQPVLVECPESNDKSGTPTSTLARFSEIEYRVKRLEDSIII